MSTKSRLMNILGDILAKIRTPSATIDYGELESTPPTEKDKPSPSSHWVLNDLYKRLKRQWSTSQGYRVSLIANTNSMEPIIDDHTVSVSEDFTTAKGKEYLKLVPISEGDICVYEADPKIWGYNQVNGEKVPFRVVHEVIMIQQINNQPHYRFKGVNNKLPDPGWIKEEKIVARSFSWNNARQPRKGD